MKPSRFTQFLSLLLVLFLATPANAQVTVDNRNTEQSAFPVSVSSSGAATQAYPIAVPPGVNGIQPNVSLVYGSGQYQDVLGVGWMLDLGSIEINMKFGTPAYTSEDLYVLKLGGGQIELVYDNRAGQQFYRAKTEGGFVRVDKVSDYWVARDRQGTKYTFGMDSDARCFDLNTPSHIYRWHLEKVEDIHGNFMTIDYYKDTTNNNNKVYPYLIEYTGNTGASLQPYAEVEFERGLRDTPHTSYAAGFKVKTVDRVNKIIVRAGGGVVRQYAIDYDPSTATGRDLLTEIQELDANGLTELPAVSYSYYGANKGFTQDTNASIPADARFSNAANTQDLGVRIIDVNGDAFPDLIRDYVAVSTSDVYTHTKKAFINNKDNTWSLNTAYNLPGDCESAPTHCATFVKEVNTTQGKEYIDFSSLVADLNGDGYNDLLVKQQIWEGDATTSISNNIDFGYTNTSAGWTNTHTWLLPNEISMMLWAHYQDGGTEAWWLQSLGNVPADVNNDGWIDFVLSNEIDPNIQGVSDVNSAITSNKSVLWSTSGKIPATITTRPGGTYTDLSKGAELVDLNGDGLPDIYYNDGTEVKVYMNEGTGWVEDPSSPWGTYSFGNLLDNSTKLADINGDGLTDLIVAKGSQSNGSRVLINSGNGWITDNDWIFPEGSFANLGTRILDADADTMLDFMMHYNGDTPKLYINDANPADLLAMVDNNYGGQISYTYGSSSDFDQTFMPFAMPVITDVTRSNGLGDQYTVSQKYEGGLWEPPVSNELFDPSAQYPATGNEFRGFGKISVDGNENQYSVTEYHQDYLKKGRPISQKSYDTNEQGQLQAEVFYEYANQPISSDDGINFTHLQKQRQCTVNASMQKKCTQTQYNYDTSGLGNLVNVIQYGEVDVTGQDIGNDEVTIQTQYINNTDADKWLLGLPKTITLYDYSNNKEREVYLSYDDLSHGAEPVEGLLTKSEQWAGSDTNPVTTYVYNALGNLISYKDANNNAVAGPESKSTVITYDGQYGIFPTKVENALDQQAMAEYYGVDGILLSENGYKGLWGQTKSVTDENGQTQYVIYDDHGRTTEVISPEDSLQYPTVHYDYNYNTNYMRTTTEVRHESGTDKVVSRYDFVDGLNRLLYTKVPSVTPDQFILSGQAEYDSQGRALKTYLPRYTFGNLNVLEFPHSTDPHSTNSYDALGRHLETINADGTRSNQEYDLWTIASFDENGHKKSAEFDAFGRIAKVIAHEGSDGRFDPQRYPDTQGNYPPRMTTSYKYDATGSLKEVTNDDGEGTTATTSIEYNELGRRKSIADPTMGTWAYEYDLNGNVLQQLDNLGQDINFTYDKINRPLTKTHGTKLDIEYKYDEGGAPENAVGRLTRILTDGLSTMEFDYDDLGRQIESAKIISSNPYEVFAQYNALDNVTKLTYPNNEEVHYAYNVNGQVTKVANSPISGTVTAPVAPSIVSTTPTLDSIAVKWTYVDGATGYDVEYTEDGTSNTLMFSVGDTNTAVIPGLEQDTTYDIRVAGFNDDYDGPFSSLVPETTLSANTAPQVDVSGSDTSVALPNTGNLVATVDDDYLPDPPATVTYTWSQLSGPDTAVFADPSAKDTTVTFPIDGTYELRLTADDSELTGSDDVTVTVNPQPPTNTAPQVDVSGSDTSVTLPNTGNLVATVYDDQLPNPPETVTYTWSQLNGPGTAVFTDPNAKDTTVSFPVDGTYELRLTADDSELTGSDDITVTVNPQSTGYMTIVKDVTTPYIDGSDTSATFNHDVTSSGSNRVLVVSVLMRDGIDIPEVTSLTYGGQTMTLAGRSTHTAYKITSEMWYLINPPTGSNTVAVSFNANISQYGIYATTLLGVDQNGPEDVSANDGQSTMPNVSITTSTPGAWVMDALISHRSSVSDVTENASQTLFAEDYLTFVVGSNSYKIVDPEGETSMDWTLSASKEWALFAVAFAPAPLSAKAEYQPDALLAQSKSQGLELPSPERMQLSGRGEMISEVVLNQSQMRWKTLVNNTGKLARAFLELFTATEAYADGPTSFDFTTFEYEDPQTALTQTASCITFDDIETLYQASYVYKAYTTTGDFVYEFDTILTDTDALSGETLIWGISEVQDKTYDQWGFTSWASLSWYKTSTNLRLKLDTKDPNNSEEISGLSLNNRYYIRISRTNTTLFAEVFSDMARTTSVGSISVTFTSDDYPYLYGFSNDKGIITGRAASGDVCNMQIGSGSSDTEAPTIPQNVAFSNETEDSLLLSWSQSTDNVDVPEYYVDVATDDQFANLVPGYADLDVGTQLSTSVTGLDAGETYYGRVRAFDQSSNVSDYSTPTATGNTLSPTVDAPVLNSAESRDGQVYLEWTNVSEADSYKVLYTPDGGNLETIPDLQDESYPVPHLQNGLEYTFAIVSVSTTLGESDPSNSMTQTPIGTPVLSITDVGDGYVDISWTEVPEASHYRYRYQWDDNGTLRTSAATESGLTKHIPSLQNGTEYSFSVRAEIGTTVEGQYSTPSTATPTANPTIDVAPTIVDSTATDTTIFVDWDSVNNATDYEIRWGTDEGGPYPNSELTGGLTEYTIPQLPADTTHYITVRAFNTYDTTGMTSAEYPKSTLAHPVPGMSTVTKEFVGNGRIGISWTPTNNTDYYVVSYGTTPSADDFTRPQTQGLTDIVEPLTNGQEWHIRVISYNQYNQTESNTVSDTPMAAPSQVYVENVKYNEIGQKTYIRYGNGVVTEYEYYPFNYRLKRIHTYDDQGTNLQDLEYEYDGVGNITKITNSLQPNTQEFIYDDLGRLVQAIGDTYGTKTYDPTPDGNLEQKGSELQYYGENLEPEHALTSTSGGKTFSYDANGNMKTMLEGGVSIVYDYDVQNRLEKVTQNGSTVADYVYDDVGERVSKTVNNLETRYFYPFYEESSQEQAHYVVMDGVRVARLTGQGQVEFIHSDHLGSHHLTTNELANVQQTQTYLPFGEFEGTPPAMAEGPKYTGQHYDAETGLYYYGARYYNPNIGRFLTADWVVPNPFSGQSFNRYSYVVNNPINITDPSGNIPLNPNLIVPQKNTDAPARPQHVDLSQGPEYIEIQNGNGGYDRYNAVSDGTLDQHLAFTGYGPFDLQMDRVRSGGFADHGRSGVSDVTFNKFEFVKDRGTGISGDPLIDNSHVRFEMLVSLNDALITGYEQGGTVELTENPSVYKVRHFLDVNTRPYKIYPYGIDPIRTLAIFHVHWSSTEGPSDQDYGTAAFDNYRYYLIDREGIKKYWYDPEGPHGHPYDPYNRGNYKLLWRWDGN